MNWMDVKDSLPKKDGFYMVSVLEPMFRFRDTDGSVVTCKELAYTRSAQLRIDVKGVRHWDFLSNEGDVQISLEGEQQKGESLLTLIEGDNSIMITAWAEMPSPYQKVVQKKDDTITAFLQKYRPKDYIFQSVLKRHGFSEEELLRTEAVRKDTLLRCPHCLFASVRLSAIEEYVADDGTPWTEWEEDCISCDRAFSLGEAEQETIYVVK